jgi:hypothetical protein
MYGLKPVPFTKACTFEKTTSGAKALINPLLFGPAKAVP